MVNAVALSEKVNLEFGSLLSCVNLVISESVRLWLWRNYSSNQPPLLSVDSILSSNNYY